MIDGKARIVSDLFCDGLGACIGECPVGAIELGEREAEPYDERAVMERIAPKGERTIAAHLTHLKEHNQTEYYSQGLAYLREHNISVTMPATEKPITACGCPGGREMSFAPAAMGTATAGSSAAGLKPLSQLRQWPVQLHLLNPEAAYFRGADVVLAADCAAYTYADFHNRFIAGKTIAIACPKLDSGRESYIEKLTAMIDRAAIDTLTVVIMEVPCCGGLLSLTRTAVSQAARKIPVKQVVIGIQGDILKEEWV